MNDTYIPKEPLHFPTRLEVGKTYQWIWGQTPAFDGHKYTVRDETHLRDMEYQNLNHMEHFDHKSFYEEVKK